jgi:uncharacterized protein DUF4157
MQATTKIVTAPQSRSVAQNAAGGKALPAVPVLQQKPNEQFEIAAAVGENKSSGSARLTSVQPIQKKANNTGLPDNLKSGIENLGGYDMSDVKVHYNSPKPSQLQAHAYAQGTDIHLAPGQERHLPHEAWHVVQQKQGRVQATMQMKSGVGVNDDEGLEREADARGSAALNDTQRKTKTNHVLVRKPVIQRVGDKMALGYENIPRESAELIKLQTGIQLIYSVQKIIKKATRNNLDENYRTQTINLEEKQKYLTAAIEAGTITELLKSDETSSAKITRSKLTDQQLIANNRKAEVVVLSIEDKTPLDLLCASQSVKNAVPILEKLKLDAKKSKDNKAIGIVKRVIDLAQDYGRHLIADPIVQGYEQGYKDSAMTQVKLMNAVSSFIDNSGFILTKVTSKDIVEISVTPKAFPESDDVHIATLYLNEKRFVKVREESIKNEVEKREIFQHRGSKKEYVQDHFNRYVKRYVKRALNNYDNPGSRGDIAINSDPRSKKKVDTPWKDIAAALPDKPEKDIVKEISSHQREKEKQGGSPFISLTTTDRPIFGSSAKNFEGEHGVATIDLAKIPKKRVFDTHTAESIKKIHDVDDPVPDMPYVQGDDRVARNSAARDSMRTREIVVSGDIPDEALVGFGKKGNMHKKTGPKKFRPVGPVIDDVD